MKKRGLAVLSAAFFLSLIIAGGCQEQPSTAPEISSAASGQVSSLAKDAGFDQFGYNYQARLFNGLADGYDRDLDGTVAGEPKYAKDRLIMKWSKAWDNARFHGAEWGPDAWCDNEWNGNVPGGTGETDHIKIVWVGKDLKYWREGGYPIWGEFEVIFEQGKYGNGPATEWLAKTNPAGYGIYK